MLISWDGWDGDDNLSCLNFIVELVDAAIWECFFPSLDNHENLCKVPQNFGGEILVQQFTLIFILVVFQLYSATRCSLVPKVY